MNIHDLNNLLITENGMPFFKMPDFVNVYLFDEKTTNHSGHNSNIFTMSNMAIKIFSEINVDKVLFIQPYALNVDVFKFAIIFNRELSTSQIDIVNEIIIESMPIGTLVRCFCISDNISQKYIGEK